MSGRVVAPDEGVASVGFACAFAAFVRVLGVFADGVAVGQAAAVAVVAADEVFYSAGLFAVVASRRGAAVGASAVSDDRHAAAVESRFHAALGAVARGSVVDLPVSYNVGGTANSYVHAAFSPIMSSRHAGCHADFATAVAVSVILVGYCYVSLQTSFWSCRDYMGYSLRRTCCNCASHFV